MCLPLRTTTGFYQVLFSLLLRALVQGNPLWLNFCACLETCVNRWLQELIQLQLNSVWIHLLHSGWARWGILGRGRAHQPAFRKYSGMLLPVFEALPLVRQNVLRNEPLKPYLCKINKLSSGIKLVIILFLFFPSPLIAYFHFLLLEHLKWSCWLEIKKKKNEVKIV